MLYQHVDYESLITFAAGELSPDSAQPVATHIAICTECSKVVRRFNLISSLMLTDDSREPPPATIARAQSIFTRLRPARVSFWQRLNWTKPSPSVHRLSRAVVLIVFLLANLVVYGGIGAIAVSAQETIPGDSLYPVKMNLESIQLAVTWDTGDRVGRHLVFADSRANETVALVVIQRLTEIPGTLAAYEKEVDQVLYNFELLVKENYKRAQSLGPGVEATMARQIATLANLRDIAVETVRPVLEHAITVGDARRLTVNSLSRPQPTPVPNIQATRLVEPTSTRVMVPIVPRTSVQPVPQSFTPAPLATPKPAGIVLPVPVSTQPAIVPVSTPTSDKIKTKTPPGLDRTPAKTPLGKGPEKLN